MSTGASNDLSDGTALWGVILLSVVYWYPKFSSQIPSWQKIQLMSSTIGFAKRLQASHLVRFNEPDILNKA